MELASKLNVKRLTNAYQVYRSFGHSRSAGRAAIKGLPISISVEPTTACNLKCPECPSGLRSFRRPTGRLKQDLFDDLISELHETLLYLIFYFQGEPYLNADFLEMVNTACRHNIYTATSTNGHFLDTENAKRTVQSGLSRLIISIDGVTQETYESYRKEGSLAKVLEGTQEIIRWKRKLNSPTPAVVWQFLVVRPNEHEVRDLYKLAREYKVDKVALKTAQIYDYENGNELIPVEARYSRYTQNSNGKWALKNRMLDECWKMWHSCVLTWDGQVVPCCFDKDATHAIGKIGEQSFSGIWYSEAYNQFRNQLFESRDQIEMCKNCTEGGKVWA